MKKKRISMDAKGAKEKAILVGSLRVLVTLLNVMDLDGTMKSGIARIQLKTVKRKKTLLAAGSAREKGT